MKKIISLFVTSFALLQLTTVNAIANCSCNAPANGRFHTLQELQDHATNFLVYCPTTCCCIQNTIGATYNPVSVIGGGMGCPVTHPANYTNCTHVIWSVQKDVGYTMSTTERNIPPNYTFGTATIAELVECYCFIGENQAPVWKIFRNQTGQVFQFDTSCEDC